MLYLQIVAPFTTAVATAVAVQQSSTRQHVSSLTSVTLAANISAKFVQVCEEYITRTTEEAFHQHDHVFQFTNLIHENPRQGPSGLCAVQDTSTGSDLCKQEDFVFP